MFISYLFWDCDVSEFPPNASSNIPYIPPAISGRPEWNKFRATCISFRQISSSSIHHESGFHQHGRELPSPAAAERNTRSEEHTSELQSQSNLVCRLLLEKKKT